MKRLWLLGAALALAGPAAQAQKYDFSAMGGGSFNFTKDITNPRGTAKGGFENGWGASVALGQNMYRYVGGEVRYTFQKHDMKLESSSGKATFGAESHAVHYDLLIHAAPTDARVRPYVAGGGGAKYYRGTGTESASQPGSNIAVLTKTNQIVGMVSVGGGVKVSISRNVQFRVDVHDYLNPFPDEVIAPVPGSSVSGWLNNIVGMAGITIVF